MTISRKILKQASELLQDEKILRKASRIKNPRHEIGKAVNIALIKVAKQMNSKNPSKTLLEQVNLYWIPIASNFGVWKIRYQLEDRLFFLTNKKNYELVSSLLKKKIRIQKHLFKNIINILKDVFQKEKLKNLEIVFRTKNIFGIYNKMKRKNQNINHINDVFALRIIVSTVEECYQILRLLHKCWPPYVERKKDYIRHPKKNGYQSLHTTLHCLEGHEVEFQIRTAEMDETAKYGPANHGLYKNIKIKI